MAIAFRAASTLDFPGSARVNSTFNVPAGTANGDVLLWMVSFVTGSAPSISTPAGWTLVDDEAWSYAGASAFGRTYLFRRVASSEPASYTITHAAMFTFGEMVAYSGANGTTPLDVATTLSSGTTTTAGSNATGASITPANNGSMLVVFRHGWDGVAVTPTVGFTERADHAAGHVQDQLQATAASTGAIAVPSGNGAGVGKPWITAVVALRDAAASEPPPYEPSWEDKVAEAAAGTAQARIMFVGDSFTEGEGVTSRAERWLDKLVAGLRTVIGIGGAGLGHIPPRHHTYLPESTPWRTPAVATPAIASKVFARAAGQSFRWTFAGDAFTLLYNGGAGLGPISVSIDGGAAETITAQSSGKIRRWDKTGLAPGTHTVLATAGTGGTQEIGLIPYSGGDSPTRGLTYVDWAWTGGTTDQWAPGGPYDVTGVQFQPHLVIDGQHGANDYLSASATPSLVASRFAARVAEYRSWASKPLVVLFVLPHMPTGSGVNEAAANSLGFTLDQYRDACVAVAEDLDVPIVDCRELLTLTLSDLASDNLHMQAAGNQTVADGIIDTLLNLSGYVPPPLELGLGDDPVIDVQLGSEPVSAMAIGSEIIWSRGSV